MELWRKKKKEKGKARTWFLENGSMFLEKLIDDCNGISNPIRMFSSNQISKATNHFDPKCYLYEDMDTNLPWTWYKGDIQGRPYAIKRFTEVGFKDEAYNDIVLSARVSNHTDFLKLIGCCFEFPSPVVVFEDVDDYRVLNVRGTVGGKDAPLLPWNTRLKIAREVATAITYLHTAFPRIIIHRDIRADNVFLDKNGTAKLTDLSSAITLPEGKSSLEVPVTGTIGYMDPILVRRGLVSEYIDVYSFGILMLVLLTGKKTLFEVSDGTSYHSTYILDHFRDLHERGEPVEFGGDSNDMNPVQMKQFLELALRCCKGKNVDRPKMILVAKEIKLIQKGTFDCFEMPESGSMSHQQLIAADSNDISNPIRMLSSNQISKSTSHLDPKCYLGPYVIVASFIFTILISYVIIKLFP